MSTSKQINQNHKENGLKVIWSQNIRKTKKKDRLDSLQDNEIWLQIFRNYKTQLCIENKPPLNFHLGFPLKVLCDTFTVSSSCFSSLQAQASAIHSTIFIWVIRASVHAANESEGGKNVFFKKQQPRFLRLSWEEGTKYKKEKTIIFEMLVERSLQQSDII